MDEVNLGDKVKDNISGIEGIVTAITENYTGSVQVRIQTRIKENGEAAEGGYLDLSPNTVTLEKGAAIITPANQDDFNKFQFGDLAEDLINGNQGIITERCIFINGCVFYYCVPHKKTKDNKEREDDRAFLPAQRLKLKKKNKVDFGLKKRKSESTSVPGKNLPGGPNRKDSDLKFRR